MAVRRTLLLACACLVLGAAPAFAAPPPNDHYLASLQMQNGDAVAREFRDTVVTTEATVQADVFNPNRDGLAFGGGGPEPTSCSGASFGRTVWYDFIPDVSGGVQIAASGYDTVVAVYEYDVGTSRLGARIACENRGAAEDLILPEVERGTAYTVQVGAVGGAAGTLQFEFLFFGDRDEDGVLDEAPDRCPRQPGIASAGGCPPALSATLSLEWANTANGVRFTTVRVRGAPKGARVEARCRRCGVRRTTARSKGRPVRLNRLVGREAPAGAVLELRVTQRPRGRGRFRHGAIGTYLRYVFEPGGIRSRTVRCLRPGSNKPRKRCT
jgi:hypothetical protein